MIIGIPKEVKDNEYRVGLVPLGVRVFIKNGHTVFVQAGAGEGSGIDDAEYVKAGAKVIKNAGELWEKADLVIKVKEPIEQEYSLMRAGQMIYTFFHLAAVPNLAEELLKREVTAIAYETIELPDGSLPLLKPMSEVAGRMAPQIAAYLLEKDVNGRGKGILLGGVPGVKRARVLLIGAGVAGLSAAKIAVGMGAHVIICDINPKRLSHVDDVFGSQVTTLMSNVGVLEHEVQSADVLIGCVLITGAKAPKIITQDMISSMNAGSVMVDISIDQGGCVETSRPTTHVDPTYEEMGVIHYCVTNIPSVVARTSTFALTNVTLPFALQIASLGLEKAAKENAAILKGINAWKGGITHPSVAAALGLSYAPLQF